MTMQTDYRAELLRRLSSERRHAASASLKCFTKLYLAEFCKAPFSRMHEELFADLEHIMVTRAGRLAVAAPRGHAKSTIVSLALVLWCALYGKEGLILIVSATREQAVKLLGHVKEQLECNTLLMRDFPQLCRMDGGPGSGRQPKPWRDNRILLANGVMICAYGAGQGLRGARNGTERPGLIVVDDLEDQDQVRSEDMRIKLRDWFNRTLLHAGYNHTNVVVIGTILHHDALLANLTARSQSRGWTARRYQAVESFATNTEHWEQWAALLDGTLHDGDQRCVQDAMAHFNQHQEAMLAGTKVLWPQWDSYVDLMLERERSGVASFQAEKQNQPIDPENAVFVEADFRFWTDTYPTLQELQKSFDGNVQYFCACDPSLGKHNHKGDYTAIITIAKDSKRKRLYVVDALIQRLKPTEIVDAIMRKRLEFPFHIVGIESVQFQAVLAPALRARMRRSPRGFQVQEMHPHTDKKARVHGLQPFMRGGGLQFNRQHTQLLNQMRDFPNGRYDDGPDALEKAVDLAFRRPMKVRWV